MRSPLSPPADDGAPFDDGAPADGDRESRAAAAPEAAARTLRDEQVIPVIAETLHVERRERTGTVRIRKQVRETTTTVDEPLREERAVVERVKVGREVDAPVPVRYEGDVMIVPIVEERLVVEKRLVLVEELHISRKAETRREPQQVTLRREEVTVERYDPETGQWSEVATPLRTSAPAQTGARSGADAALPDPVAPAAPDRDDRSPGPAKKQSS